eukprot:473717-Prorocentrum_minimum.AAC.1
MEELQLGEVIGEGAFGKVFVAGWHGRQVRRSSGARRVWRAGVARGCGARVCRVCRVWCAGVAGVGLWCGARVWHLGVAGG